MLADAKHKNIVDIQEQLKDLIGTIGACQEFSSGLAGHLQKIKEFQARNNSQVYTSPIQINHKKIEIANEEASDKFSQLASQLVGGPAHGHGTQPVVSSLEKG
jgi:uncharacterized protein YkvS